jgi:NADH dehydrogenase
MTVMVTGASGVVGRAVVSALVSRDEVRATVRRPASAEPLRALGAKVAVLDLDSPDDLAEILPRCHTLVHLVGGPNQPSPDDLFGANHGSVLRALQAAGDAGVKRFILVSAPGADPNAQHPFLRAKGLAEEAVRASGLQHAIVRATHVYGLGGLWFTAAVEGAIASPPFVAGPGTQQLSPVYAADVGAVISAIDDHPAEVSGTWAVEGPDVVTADELCSYLRDDEEPPTHADGQAAAARLSDLLGIHVDAVTASLFGLPSRADADDAAATFGVRLTPLEEGLRATLDAAASHASVEG